MLRARAEFLERWSHAFRWLKASPEMGIGGVIARRANSCSVPLASWRLNADTNDHCRLTPRAIKLRSRLAVMKTNVATHNTTSIRAVAHSLCRENRSFQPPIVSTHYGQ
jgi:hypothetical protein